VCATAHKNCPTHKPEQNGINDDPSFLFGIGLQASAGDAEQAQVELSGGVLLGQEVAEAAFGSVQFAARRDRR